MNKAVKTMSGLLAGNYCKTIVVGGKVFVIKTPTIKVIVRSSSYLSLVEIPEDASVDKMLKITSEHSENIVKGLSYLVA